MWIKMNKEGINLAIWIICLQYISLGTAQGVSFISLYNKCVTQFIKFYFICISKKILLNIC